MATSDSTAMTFTMREALEASGSKGSEKRRKPYVPIFSRMLARITEPAVGASVCASGSHVCSGHIGTFTANPAKKAQKTHHCVDAGRAVCSRSVIAKL